MAGRIGRLIRKTIGRSAAAMRTAHAQPAAQADPADLFDDAFLKKLEYLHIVAKRAFAGTGRAERATRRAGAGIEFADHRTYTAGDDLRYLDWNIYRRMDKLQLRLFEQEEDLYIYLLVDTSDSMGLGNPPKLRYAKQLCAALCYVGLANLDRVGIVTFSDGIRERMPAARGKGRIFNVFEFLRNARPSGPTRLSTSVQAFVHQTKRRGLAVLISDFYDPEGFEAALNLLRYNRFEPTAIQIYDAQEASPALRGDVDLVDCETGERRSVTVSANVLSAYAKAHRRFREQLTEFCRAKHVPHFIGDTLTPFDETILGIFRRGGFLR